MRTTAITGVLCLLVLFTSGCAFTQANLNVKYDSQNARSGPLSSIKPVVVDIQDFTDTRAEKYKIGHKRNGFGQQTADIVTEKPVPAIVKEAIAAEFSKNGHLVVDKDNTFAISGEITSFWFDTQANFWTIEFMGTVGIDLSVKAKGTGAVLYKQSYQGHYNEKSMGGLDGTWERVMNMALERMVRDVSTDNKLIAVLKDGEK